MAIDNVTLLSCVKCASMKNGCNTPWKCVLSRFDLCCRFAATFLLPVAIEFVFLLHQPGLGQTTFVQNQNRYPRVRQARVNRRAIIDSLFGSVDIEYPPDKILLIVYKRERWLELWAKPDTLNVLKSTKTYSFTDFCGDLGPKRRQGDMQIPEGFYRIDHFNPASAFHLSMRINYPNRSDSMLGVKDSLGGDIFIHGSCVTIGCIPIGDDMIEELYVICVDVTSHGQRNIPVYIFPCRMDSACMRQLELCADEDTTLLSFWRNLREGYKIFEKLHEELDFSVDKNGKYLFVSE